MVAKAKHAELAPENKPANIDVPEFGAAAAASGKNSSQAGTFSAIAAVGLGGGSGIEEVARNTRQTNDLLKKIADKKAKFPAFGGGAKG